MKIQAAVLFEPGKPWSIETVDLAEPREGEVLVRVRAAGVCRSDWHIRTGETKHPMPVVAGHEGAGVVEALGEGVEGGVKVGDHVAFNWAPNCGSCFFCGKGRPALCGEYLEPKWAGTMLDGTPRLSLGGEPVYHFTATACFAEYAVVPAMCCVPLLKEVPLEVASLIGCAVTTGVGSVLNTAKVEEGSSVAVFGIGGVGTSTVMAAKLAGAERIIVVDQTEGKCEIARSFGATDGLLMGDGVVDEIRALTEGRGVDYAFDASGVVSVQEACFESLRAGGMAVLVGIGPAGSKLALGSPEITRQEKTVTGSYYGTADPALDFPAYAQLYLEGKLPLDQMVTQRYRLDQINEAYTRLNDEDVARGVILMGD